MSIEINPNARSTFQPSGEDGPSFVLRPMTLEEEHTVFDLQAARGVWHSRLWILRHLLVDATGWHHDFEANDRTGGASDAFIQSLPVPLRASICEHVWKSVVLSESDLEK